MGKRVKLLRLRRRPAAISNKSIGFATHSYGQRARRVREADRASEPPRKAENFYDTIGVPTDARDADITSAGRKMRFRTHPDKNGNHPLVQKMYRCVDVALDILLDKQRRRVYDDLLRRGALPRHGGVHTDFDAIQRIMENPDGAGEDCGVGAEHNPGRPEWVSDLFDDIFGRRRKDQ
jgi:DnaJ-class molecular chaperone